MDSTDDDISAELPAPRTLTVLAMLMGVSVVVSWLIAYALFDALVAAELVSRSSASFDPRPRWLLGVFVCLMSVFAVVAGVMRFFSSRQLRRIDLMGE